MAVGLEPTTSSQPTEASSKRPALEVPRNLQKGILCSSKLGFQLRHGSVVQFSWGRPKRFRGPAC